MQWEGFHHYFSVKTNFLLTQITTFRRQMEKVEILQVFNIKKVLLEDAEIEKVREQVKFFLFKSTIICRLTKIQFNMNLAELSNRRRK